MRKLFNAVIIGLTILLSSFGISGAAMAQTTDSTTAPEILKQKFTAYEIVTLNPTSLVKRAQRGSMRLKFGGKTYKLKLREENLLGIKKSTVSIDLSPLQGHYSGTVSGDKNSHVRLTVREDLIRGFIRTSTTHFFIDPISEHAPTSAQPGQFVVYKPEDVITDNEMRCGSDSDAIQTDYTDANGFIKSRLGAAPTGPVTINIATDADVEFFQRYGTTEKANANIASVVNQMNGAYMLPLHAVTFNITHQNVWTNTTGSYPYTSTQNDQLLDQMAVYWNANNGSVSRDVAHLFTGKSIQDNIIGTARVGVVWRAPTQSYGFSSIVTPMVNLVAHEIGHNLRAEHICTSCDCPACANNNGPIMCNCLQSKGPATFVEQSSCTIDNWITHFAPAQTIEQGAN